MSITTTEAIETTEAEQAAEARAARKRQRQQQQFWIRRTTLKAADRSFDTAFWQAQTPEQRLTAAWEIITLADAIKGYQGTRRMNRQIVKRITGGSRNPESSREIAGENS